MASTLRTVSMALPRVSMARIPIVAFVNTHVPHANSAHPSGYSSMSKKSSATSTNSSSPTWSKAAKKAAEKLENNAKSMSGKQDHLREVKQYDNPEDEVMMNLGLAMSCNNQHQDPHGDRQQHHNQSGGKGSVAAHHPSHPHHSKVTPSEPGAFSEGTTFEETLVSQVQADVLHPSARNKEHEQELVSTFCQQLKNERASNMSQHASDAIRMVESHSVLKRDNAPVHTLNDEDFSSKSATSSRTHKGK
ncbi:hypothetical protein EMPS_02663 [Entomortierella parvispora]|uniref:Uncharacterized protein n=1 Tax=Entomortierella parvispora TaxID=205924 RepID=A0A9P3LTW4_9FUNG|nr:hypothetical protein EMPS_02663 [Entomortierella parvispora]